MGNMHGPCMVHTSETGKLAVDMAPLYAELMYWLTG